MRILLITPPFTQLNTPYPAAAYLKAFLQDSGHDVLQKDLSIELFHRLYSRDFLEKVFRSAEAIVDDGEGNSALERMVSLKEAYIDAAGIALSYLKGEGAEWTHGICYGKVLPAGHRFTAAARDGFDPEEAFGEYGLTDTARFAATLTVEELADLLHWTSQGRFGFSRYAPSLSASASSFDELYSALSDTPIDIEKEMHALLDESLGIFRPDIAACTVPFPGNLFSALSCGKFVRETRGIPFIIGGGYVNTELRDLEDPRFFDFCDYLVFDDGELPLLRIIEGGDLIRTKKRRRGGTSPAVETIAMDSPENAPQNSLPPPDYSDLDLNAYLSVLDTPSPMHRLWNEQVWIKYTLAHGCYWHRCSFCDTSLDYICRYEPKKAVKIADDIEHLIQKTGKRGFHFVDEAAPPGLLKKLSLELLRRNLKITWWTNIRFEKGFTRGLTALMSRAGCIGVAGGIETAHPRVLEIIDKGIPLPDLIRVLRNFRDSGILCHGYLMYGVPGQTLQELCDSLEVVRQIFLHRLLSSAYWHRFALTAHSRMGMNPKAYGIRITGPPFGGFARNALTYSSEAEEISRDVDEGLSASCRAYMQNTGFDEPIQYWLGDVPSPGISPEYVEACLSEEREAERAAKREAGHNEHITLLWDGPPPGKEGTSRNSSDRGETVYTFHTLEESMTLAVPGELRKAVELLTAETSRGKPVPVDTLPQGRKFLESDTFTALKTLGLMEL